MVADPEIADPAVVDPTVADLRATADRARLQPDDPAAHAAQASALLRAGRAVEAVAAADRALALDPRHADAWRDRGIGLQAQGRLRAATAAFTAALAADPDRTGLHANLGDIAVRRGDIPAALAAYRRVAPASPQFAAAAANAGHLLARRGDTGAARHRFEAALAADPADRAGAGLGLAALGAGPAPDRMPPAYVAALFDGFAADFDRALRTDLGYSIPERLAGLVGDSLVGDMASALPAAWTVFDAGCGTGLCAEVFAAALPAVAAGAIDGADLSGEMLARAARRGYRTLVQDDVVAVLAARPDSYDLIIAADVLIYLGDPAPFLRAAAAALRPGGVLALSVERLPAAAVPFRLTDDLRFAHGETALLDGLVAAGLVPDRVDAAPIRSDRGRPVDGLCCVAIRPADPGVSS